MNRRNYLKNSGLLIGGIFYSATVVSFMYSCKVEKQLEWNPVFFNNDEIQLISSFADVIIPPTDTPGASDVKVERRIDEAVFKNYEKPDQQMFLKGINHIRDTSQEIINKEFIDATASEKQKVMDFLVQEASQSRSVFHKHIYPLLKGLIMLSYFSNEIICKKVLKYDPIPGMFVGNISYDQIGGVWSLE
jgi:hypothetical protein